MPAVDLPEDMYRRVGEFRVVINAVMDDELDMETCLRLVFERGLDSMLRDILGPQDQGVLLDSIQQLAAREPAVVYRYVANILNTGAARIRERELDRPHIGFSAPE